MFPRYCTKIVLVDSIFHPLSCPKQSPTSEVDDLRRLETYGNPVAAPEAPGQEGQRLVYCFFSLRVQTPPKKVFWGGFGGVKTFLRRYLDP